jgi:hypothetical protein
VRLVATALGDFSPEEQERIIRWAREKLGLAPAPRSLSDTRAPQLPSPVDSSRHVELADLTQPPASAKDLKTFVNSKNPKNDIQFAATVAYFYRFEAPPEQRRNEIDAVILQDACRLAGRERFKRPRVTLNNAKNQGLLDRGSEAGKFTVNTIGENLVAMTLPSQSGGSAQGKKPRKPAKKSARKKK